VYTAPVSLFAVAFSSAHAFTLLLASMLQLLFALFAVFASPVPVTVFSFCAIAFCTFYSLEVTCGSYRSCPYAIFVRVVAFS